MTCISLCILCAYYDACHYADYACYFEFLGDLLSYKLFYNELSFFNKKCLQFGGTRCEIKCKYFNFASSQTCTVFTPAKTNCNCAVFGTPTTTPKPLTPNPLIDFCKTTGSSCKQTCARFKFSANQVCRITKPKNVVCYCSWFK